MERHLSKRDRAYLELLKHGVTAVRNAAENQDVERCHAESEHLHNIPGLVGCPDEEAHRFYLMSEKAAFLEWVVAQKDEDITRHVHNVYLPFWKVLEEELGS